MKNIYVGDKGPFNYICSFCGAENTIYEYVEFIDCYACKKKIKFSEDMKRNMKGRFANGVKHQRPDNRYEQEIFQSLNLSEAERKYISVEKDSIFFSFPLKVNVSIWVGGNLLHEFGDRGYAYSGEQMLSTDKEDELEKVIYEKIEKSFADELQKGGFKIGEFTPNSGELWFHKAINNMDEAKEAIKWLIDFKKRFDI